jgi:hypothetical protein
MAVALEEGGPLDVGLGEVSNPGGQVDVLVVGVV